MKCSDCGWEYCEKLEVDVSKHLLEHDLHLYGPKVDRDSGIYFVTPESGFDLRMVAEESAKIGRRDTIYDFPLFSADDPDQSLITALAIADGRAIGGVVTRNRSCAHKARIADFISNRLLSTLYTPVFEQVKKVSWHERRTIDFIWLVKTSRGRGRVGEIFRDLEDHLKVPIAELAFMVPFTATGLECLCREGLDEVFVVH